jgi:hypothetical protein
MQGLRSRSGRHKKDEKLRSFPSFFTFLVRPAGIEPTTPWFVAKYSIQLSYGR